MQELLELQTGQVAFLSGLLAGFSLTVAANILQVDAARPIRTVCLVLLLMATLLFLVALYVDVRLTIEVASLESISESTEQVIRNTRFIGTTSATMALFVFTLSIGLLGWLAGPVAGIISSILAAATLALLAYIWKMMLLVV